MLRRRSWQVDHLDFTDEPMFLSMAKFRMYEDREHDRQGNVVSSHLVNSNKRAPIIDLDFPHEYVPSTTPGHGHLYLNVPISRFWEVVLLWALYKAKVIEKGYFWWSLRRGGTFVRKPGVVKTDAERQQYSYGMFFKLRKPRG